MMGRTLLAVVMALAFGPSMLAQVMIGPSDDAEAMLKALEPGDEAILADGMYTLSGRFGLAIAGAEAEPIVIRAADGARPHFHRGDASQNIWDLDVAHVVIRGLTSTQTTPASSATAPPATAHRTSWRGT